MDFYGLDREQTIANCDSIAVGLASRDTREVCAWNRVRPEHIVDLLDQAAAEARGDARNLGKLLSQFSWRIHPADPAAAGGKRIVNNVRDITIAAVGRTFQLHCTESPSLRLERITA
ncbi:hypothetical protein ACOPJQ_12845 [Luteimonas dalianensis]|uniref:hypothetical protein n=1 Tax=Luteimonas dalianensis TaxID=1148196 RepID=UPI003BF19E5B